MPRAYIILHTGCLWPICSYYKISPNSNLIIRFSLGITVLNELRVKPKIHLHSVELDKCCTGADLGEDVLFPHEFLPLSVGSGGHHRENILAVVWYHTHKESQVFQELSHKPEKYMKGKKNT